MNFPVVFKEKRLKIRRFAAKNVEKNENKCGKPIFAEFRRFAANGGKKGGKKIAASRRIGVFPPKKGVKKHCSLLSPGDLSAAGENVHVFEPV